jgi:hypothetical protein
VAVLLGIFLGMLGVFAHFGDEMNDGTNAHHNGIIESKHEGPPSSFGKYAGFNYTMIL